MEARTWTTLFPLHLQPWILSVEQFLGPRLKHSPESPVLYTGIKKEPYQLAVEDEAWAQFCMSRGLF